MGSLWIIGLWVISGVSIVGIGLGHIYSSFLPKFCQDLVLYGKLKGKNSGGSILKYTNVPKSWFKHFYIFSTIFNLYIAFAFSSSVWKRTEYPPFLNMLVNSLETSRTVTTDTFATLLLVWLLVLHSVRRAYECLFVSVFSNGTMSLFLFVEAFLLYGSFNLAIIIETARPTDRLTEGLEGFGWRHAFGVVLFLWASYHQFDTHRRFASFRQNKKGEVISHDHVIPHGGYFEYVSCPNYLMEIMEYVAYFIIAGAANITFLSVVVFVVSNQITLSLMAHKWYLEHFKGKYPLQRKAVIPFLL